MVRILFSVSMSVFVACIVACLSELITGDSALKRQRLVFVKGMYRRETRQRKDLDKQSFSERILVPIGNTIIHRIAIAVPLNDDARERLDRQLNMAGSKLKAREYTAITVVAVIVLALLGPVVTRMLTTDRTYIMLGVVLGAYAGYTLRRFSLTSAITKRKEEIEGQLPNIIDLLSVSVTAGLGFEQALGYVTERCEGVFVDELRTLQQQLLMGRARRDAMRALSERSGVDEVATFVSSVLQADEVGISMQSILNSQAASIRQAHRQKVEEKAAKLPVKILLPIVAFIFPVLFIVLMGPAVPNLLETMGG